MSRVDGSIGDLIGGLTTLPSHRLGGREFAQECNNLRNHRTMGLVKRAPLEWVTELGDIQDSDYIEYLRFNDAIFVAIIRPRFINIDNSKVLVVYDLEGNQQAAEVEQEALTYFTDIDKLSVTTIKDMAFIANSKVKVGYSSVLDSQRFMSAIVVKQPLLENEAVTITWKDSLDANGNPVNRQVTVNGSATTKVGVYETAIVIQDALRTGFVNTLQYAHAVSGTVYVWNDSYGGYPEVSIAHSSFDDKIISINGNTKQLGDLPRYGYEGIKVEIRDDSVNNSGGLFLESKFVRAGGGSLRPVPETADAVIAGVKELRQFPGDGYRIVGFKTGNLNPANWAYNFYPNPGNPAGSISNPAVPGLNPAFTIEEFITVETIKPWMGKPTGIVVGRLSFNGSGTNRINIQSIRVIERGTGRLIADSPCWNIPNPQSPSNWNVVEFSIKAMMIADREYDVYYNDLGTGQQDQGSTIVTASSVGEIKWEEVAKPGIYNKLDPNTMPHGIRRVIVTGDPTQEVGNTDTNRFILTQKVSDENNIWAARDAGDERNSPDPEFVGQHITDLNVFQKRLAILAYDRVILSRTDSEVNFFRTTAAQILDSDPVSIGSVVNDGVAFDYFTDHNRDLLIFSRTGQYKLSGGTVVIPDSASLTRTASFDYQGSARPISNGDHVYYPFSYSKGFSGIGRYITQANNAQDTAQPITDHVSELIKGKVRLMTASSNMDMILVVAEEEPDTIYAGEWADNERGVVAWSKWLIPNGGSIRTMSIIDDIVSIIYDYNTYLRFTTMTLNVDPDQQVMLDNLMVRTNVHQELDLPTGYTTQGLVVVQGPDCPRPYTTVGYTAAGGLPIKAYDESFSDAFDADFIYGDLVLEEDMMGGTVYFGIPYPLEYIPAQPRINDAKGNVQTTAHLTVNKWIVSVQTTAAMQGQILSNVYDYDKVQYLRPNYELLDSLDGDQTFEIPYKQKVDRANLRISSTGYLPVNITNLEWTGRYIKRGRRF